MLGPEEWFVIRVIATFTIVIAMAYVVNQPAAWRLQQRLGISQLAVAGLPFIALGMIARLPAIGVVDDELLARLTPLLGLALSVIGLRIGLRVDVPDALATPRAAATLFAVRFALAGVLIYVAVTFVFGTTGFTDTSVIRVSVILALAGTVTSITVARALSGLQATDDIPLTERAIRLGEVAAVLGVLLLGAYSRPSPGTGAPLAAALTPELWLLTAIGLSGVLAILVFELLRDPAARGEDSPVLALGAVAIVAGVASYLGFSPLAIGMLVGIIIGQLSHGHRARLEAAFDRYQRAVYGLLLFVLGALAVPVPDVAILVAAVFVVARLFASLLATRIGLVIARKTVDPNAGNRLAIAPLGATAVAIVIAGHELYPHLDVAPNALALICAALATELLLRVSAGKTVAR